MKVWYSWDGDALSCRASHFMSRRANDLTICPLSRIAQKYSWDGQIFRIYWTFHQQVCDFTSVQIIHATDEEVERFAVQVGNDTDPYRASRYKKMRCILGPRCHLSENTVRILRRMFGKVTRISKLDDQKETAESTHGKLVSSARDGLNEQQNFSS